MIKSIIELTIEKLAGLGDGVGSHEGHKVFIPYTAAGDVIRASITKQTADATYAAIEEIITPSPDRVQPVCRHFGKCGGCTLQQLKDSTYTAFKQGMAQEAIRKAGFSTVAENLIRLPAASRRRAELKVYKGELGFYSEQSHEIVDIKDCKIMEPELLDLVLKMKQQLKKFPNITRIKINGVDNGYDVIVEGKDGRQWQPDNEKVKRISIREDHRINTIYQPEIVTLSLGSIKIAIPPDAFLQASVAAQNLMIDLVKTAAHNSASVLDLFAGIGTYSFPLSANARVTAIEGNSAMVAAMRTTAKEYKIPLQAEQRDLFTQPLTKNALSGYDTVIINPPRAGAKAQCGQLALSHIRKIVMISCNPATFTRDARILKEGGFTLQKLTPVDQFVFSSHLELVAEFTR